VFYHINMYLAVIFSIRYYHNKLKVELMLQRIVFVRKLNFIKRKNIIIFVILLIKW